MVVLSFFLKIMSTTFFPLTPGYCNYIRYMRIDFLYLTYRYVVFLEVFFPILGIKRNLKLIFLLNYDKLTDFCSSSPKNCFMTVSKL